MHLQGVPAASIQARACVCVNALYLSSFHTQQVITEAYDFLTNPNGESLN